MIFMGTTFCSGANSLNITPTNVSNINNITIKNSIVNDMHITKDVTYAFTTTPPEWDFNTILHALFNGNLNAGNTDITLDQVSSIRIKRRKYGDYQWVTLFEIPIEKLEDFDIERFDRYARSNTMYEYGCFTVLNNVEGIPDTNTVENKFDGVCLVSRDKIFQTELEFEHNEQKNRPVGIINTIDNKYPITVSNSNNNYYSGTLSAAFMKQNEATCEYNTKESWTLREQLNEFLCDGEPKILKFDNGQMWLISIVDNISETNKGHPDFVSTNISWNEIGDCENTEDLYYNGLIDVESW